VNDREFKQYLVKKRLERERINRELIGKVEALDSSQRVSLDMD
jgi:hypothetical protein